MKTRSSKRRKRLLIFTFILLGFAALAFLVPVVQDIVHPVRYIRCDGPELTLETPYIENGEVASASTTLLRGTKVTLEEKGETTSTIKYDGGLWLVPNSNLVESLQDVVSYDTVYPRKLVNLRTEKEGRLSDVVVKKGEPVKVVSVLASDLNRQTGVIDWFEVEKDGEIYYLPGTYVEMTEEAANKDYSELFAYNAILDKTFGDGWSRKEYLESADLKGIPTVIYPDNPLPDDARGVHITLENAINYKDELLQLKNDTELNCLVIALKGPDGRLQYQSDVPENYFKDTSSVLGYSQLTKKELADLIQEYKSAGFYIVGRLETFADAAFAQDRKDLAIVDNNGEPALYSDDYWVSPFQRETWEYNADLAEELADLGVNEVQFDFVRFPVNTMEDDANNKVNFRNTYNESKVSALQGFLSYVHERLAPKHVYTAADVYSGPIVESYDYGIGHYYPAIAAAVDVINPMVYVDIFPGFYFGIEDAGAQCRELIAKFTELAYDEVDGLQYEPILRMWLQGFNNTSGERIAKEIRGIHDGGGGGGWLLWTDQGDMEDLNYLKSGMINANKP